MEAIRLDHPDTIPGLAWTWKELEAVMLPLADNGASRLMVAHLVSGLQAMSPWLSDPAIRREIAAIFSALADSSFH